MKSQKNNLCNNNRRWSDNLFNYCSLHYRHHYFCFLMNRQELMESYIEEIIDGMDHKSMYQYVYDNLYDHLNKYDEEELKAEVEDYYPHLLEEDPLANISELEATAPDYGVGK